MKRIESPSNPRIKALRRMLQKGEYGGRWIVEGKNLFLDAVSSGVLFEEVFVTQALSQRLDHSLKALGAAGVSIYEISAALMKTISSVETPPGVLGIAARFDFAEPQTIRGFAAMLVSLRDPSNLGALARAAEASGCEFLACSSDCAEPRQPKAVRASMGSLFRVPAFKVADVNAFISKMLQLEVTVYALQPRAGRSLYQTKPRYPALIVIGGETTGVPEGVPANERITIPMQGRVESLNAAMAGTLCFYHFRQDE